MAWTPRSGRVAARRLLLLRDRAIVSVKAFSSLSRSGLSHIQSVAEAITLTKSRLMDKTGANRLNNMFLLYLRDGWPHMVRLVSGSSLFLCSAGNAVRAEVTVLRFRYAAGVSGLDMRGLALLSLRPGLRRCALNDPPSAHADGCAARSRPPRLVLAVVRAPAPRT